MILIVAFSLVLLPGATRAQDSSNVTPVLWVDFSAGFSGIREPATTVSGDVRWQHGHNLLTLQVVYTKEIEIFVPFFWFSQPTPIERITSIGILYGRTTSFHLKKILFPFPFALFIKQETDYTFSASIGVAVFDNHLRTDAIIQRNELSYIDDNGTNEYESGNNYFIGIPIQIELTEKFDRTVGYVHRLFYQWDHKRSIWGFQWGLQVYF